jgi:hypothetical protein
LFEGGYRFEPIEHQGELIGARIGIPHLGLSNEEPPLSPEGFATSSRATVTHTPHPSLP